jgi:hypothetical protein
MKAFRILIFGLALLTAGAMKAQVRVTLNLGTPPSWGPAGYNGVRYYYLPDVEAYYDVQSSMYIYLSGGRWIHRAYLPVRYRNYDLYGGYKVVMTGYHGSTPYTHFNEYRSKYARGYRGQAQRNIGGRPGNGNAREKMYSNDRPAREANPGFRNTNGKGNSKNMRGNNGSGKGNGNNGNGKGNGNNGNGKGNGNGNGHGRNK